MITRICRTVIACSLLELMSCQPQTSKAGESSSAKVESPIENKLAQYATVRLTTDLSQLSPNERQMIPLLIQAARAMDAIFWREAYGNRDSLLRSISDPAVQRYADLNYGPWDRLNNNAPFISSLRAMRPRMVLAE